MNRKYISILSLVAIFAIVGGILSIGNITAKEGPLHKINYTVEMENIFNMKAGESRDLPLNIVNLDSNAQTVKVYLTEQGNELFQSDRNLAFSKSIDASLTKSSMKLEAKSSPDVDAKSPMFVHVSIPNDAEPGMYSYSLIVQKENDSHQYIKYFYINVE